LNALLNVSVCPHEGQTMTETHEASIVSFTGARHLPQKIGELLDIAASIAMRG